LDRSVNDLTRYPQIPAALLGQARVVADRWAALPLWPKGAVIAEVGVALGGFSQSILESCQPRRFLAIDRFDLHDLPELWGKSTQEHFSGRTHRQFYEDRFAAEIRDGRMEVRQGDSSDMIAALPDDSVDLFYVDADHTYDGVRRDLDALRPKVRADGWIIMNDYLPADTFSNAPLGVIQATNEFMVGDGWEMVYFALAPIMYCDVGLRRLGSEALGPLAAGSDDRARLADQRIAGLQREVSELRATLEATRRTVSWGITAPLRALRRTLWRPRRG
jgi:hypothetical protein